MSEKPRIVIGEDELVDTPTDGTAPSAPSQAPAQQPPASSGLPPVSGNRPQQVRPNGSPGAGPANRLLNDPRWSILIAGAVGIFLGWGLAEISGVLDMTVESEGDLKNVSGLWTGLIGVVFGGVFLSFDRAVSGAWEEAAKRFAIAAIPMFVVSYVAGYLAQIIYSEILEGATVFSDPGEFKFYFARIVAWAIFGAGIGATVGLLDRSKQKAINGGLGGLAGGAVGGAIFHYITLNLDAGGAFSRLIGLMAVGLLIAWGTRLVENVRREAWLKIVAGGMSGKEFVVYHEATRIGSSPECEIFLLKDPAVQKHHARIVDHGGRRTLIAIGPVTVNHQLVQEQTLSNGDQIQIGDTIIRYSEKAITSPGV